MSARALLLRHGPLAVAVLAAAVLVASAAWNHRGVVERADELALAQGDLLARALHQELVEEEASLDEVLAAHADDGLVWLATARRGGELTDEAGVRGAPTDRLPTPEQRLVVLGETVRLAVPPGGPPRVGQGPPVPGGMPRGHGGRAPALMLEYHPLVATDLRHRAERSLFAAGATGLLLVFAALLLARLQARTAAAERDLEQARHLAALGQMSAVLAHELRNPLASLKGHAQLLGELVAEQPPLARRAGRVVSEAERLEALTDALLDFARSTRVEREPTDVAALLAAVAEGRSRVALDAPAELSFSVDPLRLRQVLDNLVDNALQADPDGTVQVSAQLDAGALVLAVRDHGPGVPAADRDRIFEPFQTDRTRGTGLGLAVARRIVQLHGGALTVADAPGGGARFTARIPPPHGA